jgi:hypothetical protein
MLLARPQCSHFTKQRVMSSVVNRLDSELKIWVPTNGRWRNRAEEMRLLALGMKDARAKAHCSGQQKV